MLYDGFMAALLDIRNFRFALARWKRCAASACTWTRAKCWAWWASRVRQERNVAGDPRAAGAGGASCGRDFLAGERLAQANSTGVATDTRARDRDDLPGADDGAESGDADWPPGGRSGVLRMPFLDGREMKRKAIAALEAVGLRDAAQRYGDYPHQFSGGQRQRILIAMALINRPRLLIADEPTTALDVTVAGAGADLLRSLQQQYGLAMLFISHDLAVVGQVAGRVAVCGPGSGGDRRKRATARPPRSTLTREACWLQCLRSRPTGTGLWRW